MMWEAKLARNARVELRECWARKHGQWGRCGKIVPVESREHLITFKVAIALGGYKAIAPFEKLGYAPVPESRNFLI